MVGEGSGRPPAAEAGDASKGVAGGGLADDVPAGGGLVEDVSPSAYRGLLRNHNYRLFFWSSLGASFGDWAGLFALQILVTTLAQGTRIALFSLGGIMMARLVPSL